MSFLNSYNNLTDREKRYQLLCRPFDKILNPFFITLAIKHFSFLLHLGL